MSELSFIGVVTAFAGGVVSFLSPCVLPLVPGYLSYIAGQSPGADDAPSVSLRRRAALSACFVFGFSTIFVILGGSIGALSRQLLVYRSEANLVGGMLMIVFGLFATGLVRIPVLERDMRWQGVLTGGRPDTAYLMGLVFALGWTPCIGPILGGVLALTAAGGMDGITLLIAYSAGLGVPFLLAAVFLDGALGPLRRARKLGRHLQVGAGGVMVVMGVVMATDRMTDVAGWLLQTFPALASVG